MIPIKGFGVVSGMSIIAEKVHFSQEEDGIWVVIVCGCLEGVDCLGEWFRELAGRWAVWGGTVHKKEGEEFFGVVEGSGKDAIVLITPCEVADLGLKRAEELKGLGHFGRSWTRSAYGWQIDWVSQHTWRRWGMLFISLSV